MPRGAHRRAGGSAFRAATGPALAIALIAGGLVVSPVASAQAADAAYALDFTLTSGGTLDGSSYALIMGGTGMPTPTQAYMDRVEQVFLAPNGFGSGGHLEAVTTPEQLLGINQSMLTGVKTLVDRVNALVGDGTISAEHPLTIYGYSQSAAIASLAMHELSGSTNPGGAIPQDYLHFVLVGNPSSPLGGLFTGFGQSTQLDGGWFQNASTVPLATPNDLYQTNVYNLEYDPVGDFPRYLGNGLAMGNVFAGSSNVHTAYLGLSPQDIINANGHPLDTTGELVSYHMLGTMSVPQLDWLLMLPFIGRPLYDLMAPTTKILSDLAYGTTGHNNVDIVNPDGTISSGPASFAEMNHLPFTGDPTITGYAQGPADVETPMNMWSILSSSNPTIPFGTLSGELGKAFQLGLNNMFHDIFSGDFLKVTPLYAIPELTSWLVGSFYNNALSSPYVENIFQLLGSTVLSGTPDDHNLFTVHDLASILTLGLGGWLLPEAPTSPLPDFPLPADLGMLPDVPTP